MIRRLMPLCALVALCLACNNGENPGEGEPGDEDFGPYAEAFDTYYAMCVENGDGLEAALAADAPETHEIIDLWHGDDFDSGYAPFVVTVGRLHPQDLEASFLRVEAYVIRGEGLEIVPMRPEHHDIDDSPVPPQYRSPNGTDLLSDIENDRYGVVLEMGTLFADPLGNIDHGILPGCEAGLLRGELVAHDNGTYDIQIDIVFEDADGNISRRGDVVTVVVD